MNKFYLLINPITNKAIEYSEFLKQDKVIAISGIDSNNNYKVDFVNALCMGPVDYDASVFQKTYNPETGLFV